MVADGEPGCNADDILASSLATTANGPGGPTLEDDRPAALDAIISGALTVLDRVEPQDLYLPDLAPDDQERVDQFLRRGRAEATLQSYRSDWDLFLAWCSERRYRPLPATPATVAAFLTELATSGFVPAADQFTRTGKLRMRQVAAAAGVPVGSFANHYRSKERFTLDVLARYADRLEEIMAATLADTDRAPRERIEAYFDAIAASLDQRDWAVGCLIPDLATEASAHSETLQLAIARIMERQTAAFAANLDALAAPGLGGDAAAVLLAAWHGMLLRVKAERSPAPVRRFRTVLHQLLDAVAPAGR